jgi:putative addiction module CopG family antidote
MTVEIPAEHQQFVKAAIASGRFESEAQVIGEALRLLEERGRQADYLRREMQVGLDDLERGDYVEHDDRSLKELFEQIKGEGRQALEGGSRG